MADIQPLRGIRYDLAKVGSLSDVVAPPYDVIGRELQDQLYAAHPNNVVRLILNRGDDLQSNETIYDSAARYLKNWRRNGVLKEDNQASMYVYHQSFEFEDQSYTRRGFISRVRLENFGEGSIYPHEETHSRVKEDRFKLMSACQANLSLIFGIYPDEKNEIQKTLENAIADRTPIQAQDHLGVLHQIWLVTDTEAISRATALMGPKPIYVADGHHRYETACDIRKAKESNGQMSLNHPGNYVLMSNVSMFDPGMIVLPTHRLFRGIPAINSVQLIDKISSGLDCEVFGIGAEKAADVWQAIVVEDSQSTMGFFCEANQTWVLARINDNGKAMMNQVAPEHSDDWRSLGVAILHNLVIGHLLGHTDLPSPSYVHTMADVIGGLRTGDASGRDATGQEGSGQPFPLSCLVMPATVDHIKRISQHGERMPAKSTYFYPKMISGLVINPIE